MLGIIFAALIFVVAPAAALWYGFNHHRKSIGYNALFRKE